MAELAPLLEALLLANGEALSLERMREIVPAEEAEIMLALEAIKQRYADESYGFELVCIAENQYQFRTKQAFASFGSELKAGKPRRLSPAALETLAIIAYRQPIVKSDIESIRGVDATPTIKTLLERGIVKIIGHRPGVGQPALYGTGEEFLKLFGLTSLSQLPTLRDLTELQQEPGETHDATTDAPAEIPG